VVDKRCSRCGEVKAAADFGRQSAMNDGLKPWCRPCARAYSTEWKRRKRLGLNKEDTASIDARIAVMKARLAGEVKSCA